LAVLACIFAARSTRATDAPPEPPPLPAGAAQVLAARPSPAPPREATLYIREYRVNGVHMLSAVDVEKAVYPYLGPERTKEDVEKAREALEQAYQDKGYKTVSVEVPPQHPARGVVILQAVERTVGRLTVNGARYYSPDEIKKHAPSLAPGTVPDFSDNGPVSKDIVALNALPDRRITPVLRAGERADTVDVDLNVKDSQPLHGSLELNNRYSANTAPWRLNGSISGANLFQQGQTLGASFQIAPQRLSDAEVFSGYYLARFPGITWLSLMLEGTDQNSNVSTLGGSAVEGKGDTVGIRAIMSLPNGRNFYHSITLGLDYKHYDQNLMLSGSNIQTPTTYFR
jgi:hemolysin activation/secretion protein